MDRYRVDEFVWVRQHPKGVDEFPRPARVARPIKAGVKTVWQYYVFYVDHDGGQATAHVSQLRRMTPLEALACQA